MTHRLRQRLMIVLAITSGATDAIGVVALGGAFTSVMTGNMVLLGVAVGHADLALAGNTASAIIGFILGCALGARVAGSPSPDDPIWPAAVRTALVVELGAFALFAAGWWATRAAPGPLTQIILLSLCATALGVQSSAIQRFGVAGLSTTYLTGTLTTVVIRLVSGVRRHEVKTGGPLLLGLVVGAAGGGLLATTAPILAPLAPLVSVAAVVIITRAWDR